MLADLFGAAARAVQVARDLPVVRETTALASQVPGVRQAGQVAQLWGSQAIREVRELADRLDGGSPVRAIEGGPAEPPDPGPAGAPAPDAADQQHSEAVRLMTDLLERSVAQSREQARQALHARTLGRLLPDEARILSALADGSVHPTVELVVRNAVGTVRHRILGNVSSIGRSAGIALPDAVHLYLANLRALGLVDIGPEDPALADRYEILMTEEVVRRAQAEAGAGRGRSVRAVRGTLRLSPLGWEVWQAATPDDPPLYAARAPRPPVD